MMRVYLCGPLDGQMARGRTWRAQAKGLCASYFDNLTLVDPLDFEDADSSDAAIVNTDKALIAGSNVVLVDGDLPTGFGTAMEILHAYNLSIPVVVWSASGTDSIWLRHHASYVTDTLDDAFEFIYALSGAL